MEHSELEGRIVLGRVATRATVKLRAVVPAVAFAADPCSTVPVRVGARPELVDSSSARRVAGEFIASLDIMPIAGSRPPFADARLRVHRMSGRVATSAAAREEGALAMDRGAIANWKTPASNAGTLTTDSGSLIGVPCSKRARFELEARPTATTPEELLAAACAGCFTMTFSELLAAAGHPPVSLRTEARVQLVRPHGYWEIPSVRLHCTANVPGIAEAQFLEIAHEARVRGPIARALHTDITMTVSLETVPGLEAGAPLRQR